MLILSTHVAFYVQVGNKACKGSNHGKGKKLSSELVHSRWNKLRLFLFTGSAQRYLTQIATLKANNTSLATALGKQNKLDTQQAMGTIIIQPNIAYINNLIQIVCKLMHSS